MQRAANAWRGKRRDLDDRKIVADTTKFDSHQMAFQWLSDLLLYEDFPTYCFGGTLFYYTIEAAAERPLRTLGQAKVCHCFRE